MSNTKVKNDVICPHCGFVLRYCCFSTQKHDGVHECVNCDKEYYLEIHEIRQYTTTAIFQKVRKEKKKMDKFDHLCTECIVCPYCGYEDCDVFEYGRDGECECDECGKHFTYEVEYTPSCTTWKIDERE